MENGEDLRFCCFEKMGKREWEREMERDRRGESRKLTVAAQEFNARTAHYIAGTPIPARITVRPDRSFHFSIRTPPTSTLLFSAAGVAPTKNKIRGAGNVAGPGVNAEGARGKTSAASPTNGNAVQIGRASCRERVF